MNTEKQAFPLDRVALALSLSLFGAVLGVIIAMVGRLLDEDFTREHYRMEDHLDRSRFRFLHEPRQTRRSTAAPGRVGIKWLIEVTT